MTQQITKIRDLRHFLLRQLDGLTTEQLNYIPPGYHNNLIWNLAHLLAAQQSLCYVRAGLPLTIDAQYVQPYLPGTRPQAAVGAQDIAAIKQLLISSADHLQADYDRGIFTNYSPSAMIAKVYGVEVNSLADALDFLLYHEGFHAGYCLALKHLVGA